jgi:hypothetical protein
MSGKINETREQLFERLYFEKQIVVGAFYELADGRIAYTNRANDRDKTVSYRLDDDNGGRTEAYDTVFKEWKPRPDLRDFPNARDPRLPYHFDLIWDIKYLSEVKAALRDGHEDAKDIRAALKKYKIAI